MINSSKRNKMQLIQKPIETEDEIIEWLENMGTSKSVVAGKIRVTKWVETYEIGTRNGNKGNSLSINDLSEVAKRIIRENKLSVDKKRELELEELEQMEQEEEAYMSSSLSDLFGYHAIGNHLRQP